MSKTSLELEVRESPDLGRYLVAARDFRTGDLVLDEEPLLLSPAGVQLGDDTLQDDVEEGTLTCVECYKLIPPGDAMRICHKCFWPVCSEECADTDPKESLHKRYECNLIASKEIPLIPNSLPRLYIIRAVLMYNDQENREPWEEFLTLTSTFSLFKGEFKAMVTKEIKVATKFANEVCNLDVDAKTVGIIVRTSFLNAFGSREKDEHGCSYQAEGIYKIGSLFAHSCSPNADWVILPTNHNDIKRWHLRVYARRNIRRNDAVFIPYIQDCLTLDTASRQKLIAQYFHFDCQCLRCLDPTEFSFYTSAVVCSYCGDKCLTADCPSDDYSPWTCTQCGMVKDHMLASLYVESFEMSLTTATEVEGLTSVKEASYDMLIRIGEEKSGLNPNHRSIIRTMCYWLQVQTYEDLTEHSKKSKDKFAKIMTRATRCLKVFRMFGVLYHIVSIEASMAYAIAAYYFKTSDMASINYDQYEPESKLKILTAVHAHLKIAVDTMEWCPYNAGYDHIRNFLRIDFKFWKDQLNTLKNVLRHGDGDGVELVGSKEYSNLPSHLKPKNLPVSFIRVRASPFLGLPSRNPDNQGNEDSVCPVETESVEVLKGTEDMPGIIVTSPAEGDLMDQLIEAVDCLTMFGNGVADFNADVESVPILKKSTGEMSEADESNLLKPDISLLDTLDFYYHA